MPPTTGQPSAREWAAADLIVNKYKDTDPTLFELCKHLTKDGRKCGQSIWLTIHQLRSVAIDLAL